MKDTLQGLVGIEIGTVRGVAPNGQPLVHWGGTARQPVAARCVWLPQEPDWATAAGLGVVLGFEGGDEARPVVLGLMSAPAVSEPAMPEPPRVLRLQSEEEIVLECGKAKIAMRADGKITILGGHLLSRATVVNKIQGGSVQLN